MTISQLLHKPIPSIPKIPKGYIHRIGWVCLYGGWILWLWSLHFDAIYFMESKVVMGELLYFGLMIFTSVPGFVILFPYFLGVVASVLFIFVRHKPLGRSLRFYSLGILESLFLIHFEMNGSLSMVSLWADLTEYPGIPLFVLANLIILISVWLVPVCARSGHIPSGLPG